MMLDSLFTRVIRQGKLAPLSRRGGPLLPRRRTWPRSDDGDQDETGLTTHLINPGLAFGEAYMNGEVVPVDCSLYTLLDLSC